MVFLTEIKLSIWVIISNAVETKTVIHLSSGLKVELIAKVSSAYKQINWPIRPKLIPVSVA